MSERQKFPRGTITPGAPVLFADLSEQDRAVVESFTQEIPRGAMFSPPLIFDGDSFVPLNSYEGLAVLSELMNK